MTAKRSMAAVKALEMNVSELGKLVEGYENPENQEV
jgi:hypothetical protein